jgi:polyferredoxin
MDSQELETRPPKSSWWQRSPLWQRLLIVLLVAVLSGLGFIWWGRAGDCEPGSHDGQCGLSSFIGFVYGIFASGIILLGGFIATLVQWRKNRRTV